MKREGRQVEKSVVVVVVKVKGNKAAAVDSDVSAYKLYTWVGGGLGVACTIVRIHNYISEYSH